MAVTLRLFLRDLADLARRPGMLAIVLALPVVLLLLIGHLHVRDPLIVVAVVDTSDEDAHAPELGRALGDLAGIEVRHWPANDARFWEQARQQRIDLVAEWFDGQWHFTMPLADRHRAPHVREVAQSLAFSLHRHDTLRTQLQDLDALRGTLEGPGAAAAGERIDSIAQQLREQAEVPTPALLALLGGRLQALHPPAVLADHTLVPGYIALIAVFLPFLFGATALVRERESGLLPMLVLASRLRWAVLAVGKLLLPVAVGLASLLLLLVSARTAFGIGIKPGLMQIVGLQVLAALASALMGLCLSTLVASAQDAYTASAVYLVASILLTGMVYPVDQFASIVALVAHTFPLTLSGPPLEAWMAQGAAAPPYGNAWLGLSAQALVAAGGCGVALRRLAARL